MSRTIELLMHVQGSTAPARRVISCFDISPPFAFCNRAAFDYAALDLPRRKNAGVGEGTMTLSCDSCYATCTFGFLYSTDQTDITSVGISLADFRRKTKGT